MPDQHISLSALLMEMRQEYRETSHDTQETMQQVGLDIQAIKKDVEVLKTATTSEAAKVLKQEQRIQALEMTRARWGMWGPILGTIVTLMTIVALGMQINSNINKTPTPKDLSPPAAEQPR